jgi:Cysteine-rich secretory protein family
VRGAIFTIAALVAGMTLPSVALAGDPVPSSTEREFVGLLNQERAAQGLSALEISPALTDVAHDYVAENVEQGGVSHDRDAPFTERANQAGCAGWSGPVMTQGYAEPAEVLQIWLDSQEHRAVLLDPENTHVGAAFKGEHALAYAMSCAPAQNTSGDFGDEVAVEGVRFGSSDPSAAAPGGSLLLASTRPSARGRMISTRVRIRAGQGTLGLIARSGKLVVRGRPVAVVRRARPYRLAVEVSRPGRWKVSLRVNGRTARRFAVRVRARR